MIVFAFIFPKCSYNVDTDILRREIIIHKAVCLVSFTSFLGVFFFPHNLRKGAEEEGRARGKGI